MVPVPQLSFIMTRAPREYLHHYIYMYPYLYLKPAEIIFCTFIPTGKSNATETFKYLYLGYSLTGAMKEYVL